MGSFARLRQPCFAVAALVPALPAHAAAQDVCQCMWLRAYALVPAGVSWLTSPAAAAMPPTADGQPGGIQAVAHGTVLHAGPAGRLLRHLLSFHLDSHCCLLHARL